MKCINIIKMCLFIKVNQILRKSYFNSYTKIQSIEWPRRFQSFIKFKAFLVGFNVFCEGVMALRVGVSFLN